MKRAILTLIAACILLSSQAQDKSPYKLNLKVDIPLIVGGAAANVAGFYYLKRKDTLTAAEVLTLDENDLNAIDRSGARQYSTNALYAGDMLFNTSFAMPILLLFDKHIRKEFLKVSIIYLDAMAITGMMYFYTAGTFNRKRPIVYNTDVPISLRTDSGNTNSFYAGHTSLTASTSFFVAKVFSDYHPDSKLRPWVWGAAAIPPLVQAYLRFKGGKHHITDNIIGYPVGAAIGILVPHLHKIKTDRLSILPYYGKGKGIMMAYKF